MLEGRRFASEVNERAPDQAAILPGVEQLLASVVAAESSRGPFSDRGYFGVTTPKEVLAATGRQILEAAELTTAMTARESGAQTGSLEDRSGVFARHRGLQRLKVDPLVGSAALAFAVAFSLTPRKRPIQLGEIAGLSQRET